MGVADGGRERGGVDEVAEFDAEFFGEEFGVGDSPGAFVADFSLLANVVEIPEGGGFGEGEAVAGEVDSMGVGGCFSEEDDVVFGGGGEGEGVFEIGGEFFESLGGGPRF